MSASDDILSFYDRSTLSAFELEGKDVTVTIEAVEQGKLPKAGSSKVERKPLIKFVGKDKRLVLNATNRKTIISMYGRKVSGWAGKKLTLYPTTTSFGPETVEAIRIRPTVPKDGAK
jgi:hypothetical protein